jgi:hypothetical protein
MTTQPPRLLEVGTDFEREVLSSARLDAGGDTGLRRTLVAMGVSAGTISTTAATAGAGIAAGSTVAAVGGGGSALGVGVLVKWASVGVAVAVLGGGAVGSSGSLLHKASTRPVVTSRSTPTTPRISASAEPPVSGPFAALAVSPAPTQQSSTVIAAPIAQVHSSATPSRTTAADAPAAPPAPTQPSSLDAELATLDRVRASLAKGNASDALRDLDAYDRAFPASLLADEASVLRADALVVQGDRALAAVLARRFLAANPSSPHASHLLRILGGSH